MTKALHECVKDQCCSENLYEEIPIKTWDDLVKFRAKLYDEKKDSNKRWLFRGQEKSNWCLNTTLERLLLERFNEPLTEAWRYERLLLRQFARAGDRFLTWRPQSPMEWLAVMRHHGGPTRLSDWTYSFWIALYFAVEKANHSSTCAIWALDIAELKENVREKKGFSKLKNILKNGSNTPKEFDFILDSKNKVGIWPVNPFRLNERLYMQQGVFLLPLDVTRPFMMNLQAVMPEKPKSGHLYKILISSNKDLLHKCLIELQRMNINTETLFRGLDGFARNFSNYPGTPILFEDISNKMLDKPLRKLIYPTY